MATQTLRADLDEAIEDIVEVKSTLENAYRPEPTYTPKLTTFLELIRAGTTVKVARVERRGLDLRGLSTLPLKDVENRLCILAELGYRELCVRLLVSDRQMTRSWASEYLEQVLADDRGR